MEFILKDRIDKIILIGMTKMLLEVKNNKKLKMPHDQKI